MLAALASAQAARDPSTAAHCARVTYLAARLAVWLGWDDERIRTLGYEVNDSGDILLSRV